MQWRLNRKMYINTIRKPLQAFFQIICYNSFVRNGGDLLSSERLPVFSAEERAIYAIISVSDGIKAKDIASRLSLSRASVNHLLYSSALMRELCFQDQSYSWHALVRQSPVHDGLYDFSGWYSTVREFLNTSESIWLSDLKDGCERIGRNLNNTRGLFHSFLDCRRVMVSLFRDLDEITDMPYSDWEIVFELRINRARMIRIYADVLVITPDKVFSLEFKMKNIVDPAEVLQAAKYCPFLEVIFGPRYEVVPALVLTTASELFEFVPLGNSDMLLPVSSGDMLFNIFNEYLAFLA